MSPSQNAPRRRRGVAPSNLIVVAAALAAPLLAGLVLVGMAAARLAASTPTVGAAPTVTSAHTSATAASTAVATPPDNAQPNTSTPGLPPTEGESLSPEPSPPASTPTAIITPAIDVSSTPGEATSTATILAVQTEAPTLSATGAGATATSSALVRIQNDQACIDATYGDLIYVYGEVVNLTTTNFLIDMDLKVLGDAGELTISDVTLDIPGQQLLPASRTLPFVVIAHIDQPTYRSYRLEPSLEPTDRRARSDIGIDGFTPVTDPDLTSEVTVNWTNSGSTALEDYVDIYAAAYDAQGRVANLTYETIVDPFDLEPGQHTFTVYLYSTESCGSGTIQASVIGE